MAKKKNEIPMEELKK